MNKLTRGIFHVPPITVPDATYSEADLTRRMQFPSWHDFSWHILKRNSSLCLYCFGLIFQYTLLSFYVVFRWCWYAVHFEQCRRNELLISPPTDLHSNRKELYPGWVYGFTGVGPAAYPGLIYSYFITKWFFRKWREKFYPGQSVVGLGFLLVDLQSSGFLVISALSLFGAAETTHLIETIRCSYRFSPCKKVDLLQK